jgi:alkanesulfonate monooxygenase SsuD/methylene tetrahydromethanopterin reductase-like flavin-dependent oxidoreductase (luciferase family)
MARTRARDPRTPTGIWLGAFKPRMLRLVGRKAGGWLPSLGVLTREELLAGDVVPHVGRSG